MSVPHICMIVLLSLLYASGAAGKPMQPAAKVMLPSPALASSAGGGSFSFAGSLVDGAAPTTLNWVRVGSGPVNRVELFLEYTAFTPSYTSELAIRIQHLASGFDVLIGGNDGCAAFGPCTLRRSWPAQPGTITDSVSFTPVIVNGSGAWTVTLRDSFNDAGNDGQFVTGLLVLSFSEAEPNNDFSSAKALVCDDGLVAQINPMSDLDFYRFDGQPGSLLRVDLDANELGLALDSVMRIYRSDHSVMTSSDDAAAPGEPVTLDSFIQLVVPADGRIFFSIESLQGASAGAYRLTTRCPATLDTFEPNNNSTLATAAPCNTVLHAHVEGSGDVDFYTVNGLPGSVLSADVDTTAFGSLDSILGAFDSGLNPIAVSDDDPAPGETPALESYLSVLVPADGLVLLAVTSYDDFDFDGVSDQGQFQSTGPYTLELSGMCATPGWSDVDSDNDAIPDTADNCTLHANPSQADVDNDGYGNRCDPDFDNSGLVNFNDLNQMRTGFFTTDPLLDLNSDGTVNFLDLNIMRNFFFLQPGPSASQRDDDGDGWDDAQDTCVTTPPGAMLAQPGCALLEVAQQPERFSANVSTALRTLSHELQTQGMGDLPAVAAQLDELLLMIEVANRQLAEGQLCEGRDLLTQGVADFHVPALELLSEYTSDYQAGIAPLPPSLEPVDGGGIESRFLTLLYWRNELGRLGNDLANLQDLYTALCETGAALSPQTVTIAEVSDHLRRFTDTAGRVYAFRDQFESNDYYRSGSSVVVAGVSFGDGTYIATDVSAMTYNPPPLAPPSPCLELRVAPRQPMAPLFPGPFELLSLGGYTSANTLRLEKDQRLAVVDTGCATTSILGPVRHSLKIRMNYQDQTSTFKTMTLSHDLSVSHPPVPLPATISSNTASMTVEHRVQVCTVPGVANSCGDPLIYHQAVYSTRVFERASRCEIQMDNTQFALPDGTATTAQLRTTRVGQINLTETPDPGSFQLFAARGYKMDGSSSSYPTEKTITLNQDFGVYNFDAYTSAAPIFASDYTGVQRPSPLTWPSAMALRNGKLFRYSCGTQPIVRDVLSFCGLSTPSYYRFPFSAAWLVTQGNFGTFSHNTAGLEHAWDIAMSNNTPLLAARGGTVIEAVESGSTACPSAPSTCVGNRVQIRHQDASIGNYFHINFNGALVNVGDTVKRGQVIANSDNTGFTTGPHLHFEVLNETKTGTVPSKFDGKTGFNVSPVSCYVPVYGDLLWGN